MNKQAQFFPLTGGLDIITAAIAAKPGTARASLNYESDATGYRRMAGDERYDGQTSPTDAYDAESNEIAGAVAREAARDAITQVPGVGEVHGVWYYNGDLYAWRDSVEVSPELLTNGGFDTDLSGWTNESVGGTAVWSGGKAVLTTVVTAVDSAVIKQTISTVPGVTYNLEVKVDNYTGAAGWYVGANGNWAFFNQTATGTFNVHFVATGTTAEISLHVSSWTGTGTSATFDYVSVKAVAEGRMYKATPTGWDLISTAFAAGGKYEFVNYNFTGAASEVKMYGVNGTGKAFQFDGTTVTFITTGMANDKPIKIEAHKRHLFLAFPGGSLQHSAIGDPLTWTAVTGAAELALGDEITNLVSAAPANLVVTSKNSVSLLYGSDASDWQLETITNEAGALPFTAEKMGTVIYMDNRGLRSMSTTPAFGNFNIGTMTMTIAPLIRTKLAAGQTPVASCRVRGKDVYRVFFDDGYGLSVYIGRKQAEIMPIDLGVPITCICSAETENNIEKIWFGDQNGWVYQMDKGRSFDGEGFPYHIRLPFNHMGGPRVLKRWHKAIIEYDASTTINVKVTGEVDYADPSEPALVEQSIVGPGGGGFWDTINWDQFFWSAPVEGKLEVWIDAIGDSMSLLLGGNEANEEPHILQGITLVFSVRGVKR